MKKDFFRKKPALRTFLLVLGVMIAVALYSSFFGSHSPNYYQLRSKADEFVAPADWQFEGNRENRGQLGLWCLQLTGPLCPYYSQTYIADKPDSAQDVLATLQQLPSNESAEMKGCFESRYETTIFNCTIEVRDEKILVRYSATTNQVESGKVRYAVSYSR